MKSNFHRKALIPRYQRLSNEKFSINIGEIRAIRKITNSSRDVNVKNDFLSKSNRTNRIRKSKTSNINNVKNKINLDEELLKSISNLLSERAIEISYLFLNEDDKKERELQKNINKLKLIVFKIKGDPN